MSKGLSQNSTGPSLEREIDVHGLSSEEARSQFEIYGPNRLTIKKRKSPLIIFVQQFKSPLIYILLIAAVLSVVIELESMYLIGNEVPFKQPGLDAIVILVTVLANVLLGFAQEWKAERAVEAVKSLLQERARVIRDGEELDILAENVVPGDMLLIRAGERVAADGRVVYESNLHIDESILTGESVPVRKTAADTTDSTTTPEHSNLVLAGSFVTEGRGRVLVVATGDRTVLGKINREVTTIQKEKSPFSLKIKGLSLFFLMFSMFFLVIIFIMGLYREMPIYRLLLLSVSILVSSIPEGLPAVITVVLSVGVYRLAKKRVIVRDLSILESLGVANVICTDKTGTLTMNQMTVRRIMTPDHSLEIIGTPSHDQSHILRVVERHSHRQSHSSTPDRAAEMPDEVLQQEILLSPDTLRSEDYSDVRRLLVALTLCNDAEIYYECVTGGKCKGDSRPQVAHILRTRGSPTEASLLVIADAMGVNKESCEEAWPRVSEIAFSSEKKYMATLHQVGPIQANETDLGIDLSHNVIVVKGASEVVKEYLEVVPPDLEAAVQEYASQGLRVIACAIKAVPTDKDVLQPSDLHEMTLLGICGINDPPRPGVADYVKACENAGITVLMITGDNEFTAKAIGKEVGIFRPERGDVSLTGPEIDKMNDSELVQAIRENVRVFSRTDPLHKLRIVNALLHDKRIVVMTGDGVNDSPALRQASVGIAMGVTGTDMAKEAADIVLQEERFETIVDGIDEGRNILLSMRRVVQFYLTTALTQNMVIILGLMLFLAPVMSPMQILWVNLAATGLTDIGLGLEPKVKGLLERAPLSAREKIVSRRVLSLSIFHAILMIVMCMSVYALYAPVDTRRASMLLFLTIVVLQLAHSFNCRSQDSSILKIGILRNRAHLVLVAISALLVVMIFFVPVLAYVLLDIEVGTVDYGSSLLTVFEWMLILMLGALMIVADEVRKAISTRLTKT